jgi:N-glycosylase/DNA lyase
MSELNTVYLGIRDQIDARLGEFKKLFAEGSDKALFTEMCFCMCTPQNNAQKAWGAVSALSDSGLLEHGSAEDIADALRADGVRFHKNKASYIVKNRPVCYPDTKARVARVMREHSEPDARSYFARAIHGWGLKEASHFLRNIGFGSSICILDRHIVRELVLHGVIASAPSALSPHTYFAIERDMMRFAAREGIPVDALDLVLWYQEKGEIFK